MRKSAVINSILIIILIAVIGLGSYLYQKTQIQESATNVSTDSTGGALSVKETPVDQTPEDTKLQTMAENNKNMNKVTVDTNFGKIVVELYPKDAPKTVENFVTLAKKGFYDGLTFHRVISGFMIQGGDPLGTGTGGPGYTFADELDPNTPSAKAGYKKGVLAMANAGPNTNGSQFFIMLADYPLPRNYTIFGRVILGQEVVDKIGQIKTGPNDRPVTPVVMKMVTVGE